MTLQFIVDTPHERAPAAKLKNAILSLSLSRRRRRSSRSRSSSSRLSSSLALDTCVFVCRMPGGIEAVVLQGAAGSLGFTASTPLRRRALRGDGSLRRLERTGAAAGVPTALSFLGLNLLSRFERERESARARHFWVTTNHGTGPTGRRSGRCEPSQRLSLSRKRERERELLAPYLPTRAVRNQTVGRTSTPA